VRTAVEGMSALSDIRREVMNLSERISDLEKRIGDLEKK
jgi:hypothetical protein